ncbi:unnamed protein product [Sympodiomycopsis kandeliae]
MPRFAPSNKGKDKAQDVSKTPTVDASDGDGDDDHDSDAAQEEEELPEAGNGQSGSCTTGIRSISKGDIHRITSGQVVLDLQSAIKELIENSLDAGATSIEVRMKNHGLEGFEVIDNGHGIAKEDYHSVALKHHTSKLTSFQDLTQVLTFGFRGEAISSLCANSQHLTILTSTEKESPMGTLLEFSPSGSLLSSSKKLARQRGCTISVMNLFHNLPVRRKELEKNIKREYNKVLTVLQYYILISNNVRWLVTNTSSEGKKSIPLNISSSGAGNAAGWLRKNFASLFGPKASLGLQELDLDLSVQEHHQQQVLGRRFGKASQKMPNGRAPAAKRRRLNGGDDSADEDDDQHLRDDDDRSESDSEEKDDSNSNDTSPPLTITVKGLISSPRQNTSRTSTDRQFFYINGRPWDNPKLSRSINELFRSSTTTSTHSIPSIIADFNLPTDSYDVNISPDKRSIFLHLENEIISAFRNSLQEVFDREKGVLDVNTTQQQRHKQGTLNYTKTTQPEDQEEDQEEMDKNRSQHLADGGERGQDQDKEIEDDDVHGQEHPQGQGQDQDVDYDQEHPEDQDQGFDVNDDYRQEHPEDQEVDGDDDRHNSEGHPQGQDVDVDEDNSHYSQELSEDQDVMVLDSDSSDQEHEPALGHNGSNTLFRGSQDLDDDDEGHADDESHPGPSRPMQSSHATALTSNTFARPATNIPTGRSMASLIPTPSRRQAVPAPAKKSIANMLTGFARPGSPVQLQSQPAAEDDDRSETSANEDDQASARPASPCCQHHDDDGASDSDAYRDREEDADYLRQSKHVSMVSSDPSLEDEVDQERQENLHLLDRDALSTDKSYTRTPVSRGEAVSTVDMEFLRRFVTRHTSSSNGGDRESDSSPSGVYVNPSAVTSQADTQSRSRSASSGGDLSKTAGLSDDLSEEVVNVSLQRVIKKGDFSEMSILGQFNLGFIIVRRRTCTEDDLFIIDQHASDEKYNFETLQTSTKIQSQRLIQGKTLELSSTDELVAIQHFDTLIRNGFEIEIDENAPAGSRVQLVAQPVSKNVVFGVRDLEELLYLLRDVSPNSSKASTLKCSKARMMFASRACRKSVMIGTALNTRQMKMIVNHMGEIDQPWNCPHGRPTMRHLSCLQKGKEGGVRKRKGELKWENVLNL